MAKRTSKKRVKKHAQASARAKKRPIVKPAREAKATPKKPTGSVSAKQRSRKKADASPKADKRSVGSVSLRLSRANDTVASRNSRGVTHPGASPDKKPSASKRTGGLEPAVSDASATSQDPIQFPEEKPFPKTHLTAKELRKFKVLLLEKRAELVGDVRLLSDEALNNKTSGRDEHATMPIHMADLGSDNWEQEFTLGLLANEQAIVREIDQALERVRDKTYGICLATRQPISKARLLAKPWAKYCIEYARAREEGRAL